MRSTRLFSLFLIAVAAFAQHGGGFRGGSAAGFRFGGGRVGSPVFRDGRFFGPNFGVNRGFYRRFGNFANGYYSPYFNYFPYLGAYALMGDYSLLGDYFAYPGPAEYPVINNNAVSMPADSQAESSPPVSQAQPAQPVVHEYKWNEPTTAPNEQNATFTIALKDGSKRYSVMAWVQNRQLYYLDSEGHQQVLAANVIDRDATERLNREKNLNLRLPPG